MNSGESSGESSSCGRENGSASTDPERPHKKARFPWQIKGKHHLKDQTDQATESLAATPLDPSQITPPSKSDTSISSKLPIIDSSITNFENEDTSKGTKRLIWHGSGRPPLSPDGNPLLPLETVISLAQSMLMRSVAGGSNHFDTSRETINNMLELDLEAGPSSPLTTAREARRLRKEEDKCISRWQAAQNVKGCFDNTLNSVLDSWMSARPAEDRLVALDFARIMNDLPPSDDNIENEAILMAINAHGLQNVPTVAGVPAIAPSEQLARTLASDIPICEDSDSSLCSEDFEISDRDSYSPWPLDDPITQTVNENQQPDKETVHNAEHSCRQIQDNRLASQPTPYLYRNNHTTTEEDYEYEFMNTAVIQAIKSKGLMAAGTDFG